MLGEWDRDGGRKRQVLKAEDPYQSGDSWHVVVGRDELTNGKLRE